MYENNMHKLDWESVVIPLKEAGASLNIEEYTEYCKILPEVSSITENLEELYLIIEIPNVRKEIIRVVYFI